MTRLAEIDAHIASMRELFDVVSAMRSLAGMRVQEAQRALPGIRRYAEAIAAGLADTLLLTGEPRAAERRGVSRAALVLCMAEHGFVGAFNERLIEAARGALDGDGVLLVLGSRGAALAGEAWRPASWTHPMATRCPAAPDSVQHVSTELYRRIARGEIDRVEVIFARYLQGAAITVERRLLLPLDLGALRRKQARQPPLHNLEPAALHEKLMAEYVFALLTEAVVESIASENAARLAAMESARDKVGRKLDRLRQEAHQARQDEITNDLLELIAGAEAAAWDGALPGH